MKKQMLTTMMMTSSRRRHRSDKMMSSFASGGSNSNDNNNQSIMFCRQKTPAARGGNGGDRLPRRSCTEINQSRLRCSDTDTTIIMIMVALFFLILMSTINTVNAENPEDEIPTSTSSHMTFASDLLSSLSSSDSINSDYGSSNSDDDSLQNSEMAPVFIRPLSCFVCSTVKDINCKNLNYTALEYEQSSSVVTDNSPEELENPELDRAIELGRLRSHVRAISLSSFDTIELESQTAAPGMRQRTQQQEHQLRTFNQNKQQQPQSSSMYEQHRRTRYEQEAPEISLEKAHQLFGERCTNNEQYCIVRRLGVSDPDPKSKNFSFFGLQRGCAKDCQPGCFIIGNGERTKLNFCTSCCTSDYCNVDNSSRQKFGTPHLTYYLPAIVIIFINILRH